MMLVFVFPLTGCVATQEPTDSYLIFTIAALDQYNNKPDNSIPRSINLFFQSNDTLFDEFHPPPTKMSSDHYKYDPSFAAAAIFIVGFTGSALFHAYQIFKLKAWFFIPFFIGCVGKPSPITHPIQNHRYRHSTNEM